MSANRRRVFDILGATPATATATATATANEQLSLLPAGNGDEDALEMPRICRCCCKRDLELLGLFDANQPSLVEATLAPSTGTSTASATTTGSTATSETASATPATSATPASTGAPEALHNSTAVTATVTPLSSSTPPPKSRTTLATTSATAAAAAATAAAAVGGGAPRGRSSDNPVEYALSGAHSSMDIVLEEMIIWMLNINRDDGLPQEICRQCMAQFLMVAKFRRKCVRMQQRLQDFAQDISDRQAARQAKRQQKQAQKLEEPKKEAQPAPQPERKRRMVSESDREAVAAATAAAAAETPAEIRTESQNLPPPKARRLQLRLRKYRALSIGCEMEHRSAIDASSMPWKTKAARKQISETWTSSSITTEITSPTPNSDQESKSCSSTERMSDMSVGPCCGFESDSSPSSTSTQSTVTNGLKFPKRLAGYQSTPRRGRRVRNFPVYNPTKRQRRSFVKKELQVELQVQAVAEENTKSDQMEVCQPQSKAENCDEAIDSTSDIPKETSEQLELNEVNSNHSGVEVASEKESTNTSNGLTESRTQEGSLTVESVNSKEVSNGPEKATSDEGKEEPAEAKEVTNNISEQAADQKDTEIVNKTDESFSKGSPEKMEETSDDKDTSLIDDLQSPNDPLQSEELTSSTETSEDQQESVDQPEIIVSIPLEVLDENLQRRLVVDQDIEKKSQDRTTSTSKELQSVQPDDVNNNANDENFCQSATADSFNSTVALRTNEIEAKPEGGGGAMDPIAEETPSAEESPPEESDTDEEMPVVRSGPTPMDFMAEFAKHCENGIEQLKATTPAPSPTPSELPLPLNDLEAKQQLEVEMNDVETTLNGILNEMQDQHMYTPNCAHIDEFLTPADYAPLTEQEPSVSSPPNPFEESPVTEPETKQPAASEDLFDNSNFSNELIGFQNDIPCFENIDSSPESGQQSLHLELTQFLSDLQPSQEEKPTVEAPVEIQTDVQAEAQVQSPNASETLSQRDPTEQHEIQIQPQAESQMQHEILTVQAPEEHPQNHAHIEHQIVAVENQIQLHNPSQSSNTHQMLQPQPRIQNQAQPTVQMMQQIQPHGYSQLQLQSSQVVPHVQSRDTTTTVTYEQIYQQHIVQQTVQQSSNKVQLISLPSCAGETRQWQPQHQQHQQQVQWSSVGGLESIKNSPIETTYYISASDLYPQQTTETYTMLQPASVESNENYMLEQVTHQQSQQQHHHQQQQQQQEQHEQQQQQPIMIVIQPEMQQPVASASNPQQAPLHRYGAPISNDLHRLQYTKRLQHRQQQHQQQQQQQQHQQHRQHHLPVHSHPVIGMPGATSISTKVHPIPATTPSGRPLTLKCRFCQNGPRFSNSLEYSRHIIELHPAIAPFNCPHCPLAFAGRSKRSQHILSNHVVQQYQCGQCSQVFPAQKALDLHIQRFHMPLKTVGSVRVEDVQLQITNERQERRPQLPYQPRPYQPRQQRQPQRTPHHRPQQEQPQQKLPVMQPSHSPHPSTMDVQASTTIPRKILCCPDCEDCTTGHSHTSSVGFEEQSLQSPPTVLTPPSTIVSAPSPQPMMVSQHITLPSPEQSEPDSTTTLRQYRKRGVIVGPQGPLHLATPVASPSPSSSPSSSTFDHVPPASPATPASPAPPQSPAPLSCVPVNELRTNNQCLYCEERFTNEIALKKHHQLAHGSQTTMPFVCTICKRGYRMRTALHRHMESHDVEGRPYECNICHVRFPRPSQLTLHKITVHLLSKPHTCDECGKQFGTESALKTHVKFHGAHMNSHLPLGVFLNEETIVKTVSNSNSSNTNNNNNNNNNNNGILSSAKLENPPTPIEETAPMSNNSVYNVQSPDEYPNSVESSAATSVALETIAPTP
ncbi:protein split ends isoform X2 [Drosophila serrata]|uniref:protein split ends isoform X2 n=1 Tax=Drosophila serrata TaxID=7274 RepID=UPI000A1D2FAF|nr:protein split ends isoform X2 [Drosophila serrata]